MVLKENSSEKVDKSAVSTVEATIPLLVIAGPTASGKTALSVTLAERLNGEVVCADSLGLLSRMKKGRFGLIFLDPPYHGDLLSQALLKICTLDLLAQGGIIICETEFGVSLPELPAPYRVLKEYRYGKTAVVTVTRDGTEE